VRRPELCGPQRSSELPVPKESQVGLAILGAEERRFRVVPALPDMVRDPGCCSVCELRQIIGTSAELRMVPPEFVPD
jgi:hypothetical protein